MAKAHVHAFTLHDLHICNIKGTVRQYGSRAITRYFTGCEIITKPKVYVVLQYLRKEGSQVGADNARC